MPAQTVFESRVPVKIWSSEIEDEARAQLQRTAALPGAYKDIDEVMANQSDLVEIVAQLKQVLCVKG